LPASADARRALIESDHESLSIRHQCELLDLPRSTLYYRPASETPENLSLMRLLDKQYLKTPYYGSRKMAIALAAHGQAVNRKRVQRLTAIMDWYSRYVLTWRLSNRLEGSFCLEALDAALKKEKPEIFNTDQGAQFTSLEFTSRLLDRAVAVSMDGRGRALDNVFIERLWRSLKYEDIYLKDYGTVDELYEGLTRYFDTYNHERFHQALDYRTPYQVYHGGREINSGSSSRVRVKRVGKKSAA
jgi:putative transposase